MKHCTPVICSNIYGNNHIVKNWYNGFLFNLEGYNDIKNNLNLSYNDILSYLNKLNEQTKKMHMLV